MPRPPAPMAAQWQQAMNLTYFSSPGGFFGATTLFCMQDEVLCYRTQGHRDPCQTQAPQPLCLSPPRTFS